MLIVNHDLKWNGKLEKRDITKYIILHHAKASKATVQDIDRWHKENGWLGIGYNFYITKDGLIHEGRPVWATGSHTKGYNATAIGICFEGDFDKEIPTELQTDAGIELIRELLKNFPNAKVIKHKDVNRTDCPGKFFKQKIITEGIKMEQKHWAEDIFTELNNMGIKINERRFDDNIKRGEVFALLWQVVKLFFKK